MKSVLIVFVLGLMAAWPVSNAYGQEDKSTRPSPPAEAHAVIGDRKVDVYYSSPAVKGRTIWGSLVPYGKVWRTGANEATVFETSGDLIIGGKTLPAGKYALFTIPGEKEWTVIFNSVWDQWGAYKYDAAKDVLRISARPEKSTAYHERLKFDISDNEVVIHWENMRVGFMLR